MGDISTPDFSLGDLNVDGDGDALMKETTSNYDENGSSDVQNFVSAIQGDFTDIDEPLTTEDILKTINDCTSKLDEGDNVSMENDDIEKTLQQTESERNPETDCTQKNEEVTKDSTENDLGNLEKTDKTPVTEAVDENFTEPETSLPDNGASVTENTEVTAQNEIPNVGVLDDNQNKDGQTEESENNRDCESTNSMTRDKDEANRVVLLNKDCTNETNAKTNNALETSAVDSVTEPKESDNDKTSKNEESTKDSGVENKEETNDGKDDDAIKLVLNDDISIGSSQIIENDSSLIVMNDDSSLITIEENDVVIINNEDSVKTSNSQLQNGINGTSAPPAVPVRRKCVITNEKMELDPIAAAAGIKPEQVPAPLSHEELIQKLKMFSVGNPAVQFIKLHCTSCNVHLGSSIVNQKNRYIHPVLKVLICKDCYDFYTSGDFDKDEDGSELYCRWCGQGGNVLCCGYCEFVFCKKCIRTNLGKKKLEYVKKNDDWVCFGCDNSQTVKHRITAVALFEYVTDEIKRISTMNCPELEKNDYTTCCRDKIKPLPVKRVNNEEHEGTKKKMKRGPKIPVIKDEIDYYQPFDLADTIWGVQQANEFQQQQQPQQQEEEEEEVVCAPDLSMLMGDDDGLKDRCESPITTISSTLSTPPLPATPPITSELPSTAPAPSYLRVRNVINLLPETDDVQIVSHTLPTTNQVTLMPRIPNVSIASNMPPRMQINQSNKNVLDKPLTLPPFIRIASRPGLPKQPIILNRYVPDSNKRPSLHNPPNQLRPIKPNVAARSGPPPGYIRAPNARVRAVTNSNTPPPGNNVSYVNNIPARFLPGLKHEWFDTAERVTKGVYTKLANSLNGLVKEKTTAQSIEDLASVHNKLQEVLSGSINTLIQVRRNLRNEFIKGLNQIKLNKARVPGPYHNNDVIIIPPISANSVIPTANSGILSTNSIIPMANTVASAPMTSLSIPMTPIIQNQTNTIMTVPVSAAPISLALISSAPITAALVSAPPISSSANSFSSINSFPSSVNSFPAPINALSSSTPPPPLIPYKKEDKPKTYLKVKSVSQLLSVPSECITIPDVLQPSKSFILSNTLKKPIVIDELTEPVLKSIPELSNVTETVAISSPVMTVPGLVQIQNLPESAVNNVVVPPEKTVVQNDLPETKVAINEETVVKSNSKEEFDKRMKTMIDDNLTKYRFPVNLSVRDVKYMLSARVHLQDICRMSILQMLLSDQKDDSRSEVINKISKSCIGRIKRKLTNKLRIGRVRNRDSRTSLYTIIHSSNSDSSSSEAENEWNPPCTDSGSDN